MIFPRTLEISSPEIFPNKSFKESALQTFTNVMQSISDSNSFLVVIVPFGLNYCKVMIILG